MESIHIFSYIKALCNLYTFWYTYSPYLYYKIYVYYGLIYNFIDKTFAFSCVIIFHIIKSFLVHNLFCIIYYRMDTFELYNSDCSLTLLDSLCFLMVNAHHNFNLPKIILRFLIKTILNIFFFIIIFVHTLLIIMFCLLA